VLGVGIDWAEEFHLVALGRPGEGVIEVVRVGHNPRAVDALVDKVAALERDPAQVRVVIETRHGLLVNRLVDAGFVVIPVNPDLISRRRGPAKKKDDAEDARIACLLALDRFAELRPLIPMARSPRSYAPSLETMSGRSATSGGCSTGFAPIC
jgi:Transposase